MANTTEEQKQAESTFDADEFRKSIMDEVNKTVNSINKNLTKELGKLTGASKKQETQAATEAETPEEKQGNAALPPEVNAALRQVKSLTAKLEEKEKAIAASEAARLETERKAGIREAMNGIQFASKTTADLFYKAISGDVIRNEDGELVAKTEAGDLPLKDYVLEMAEGNPSFLAPKGMGGSGANAGKLAGKGAVDMSEIKPGMSKDTFDAAWKQAASHLMGPSQ